MRKTSIPKLPILLLATLAFIFTADSIHAQTAQCWWGMWDSSMPLNEVGELPSGPNNLSIRLQPRSEMAVGAQLHAIRFYIGDKTSVERVAVWAATRSFSWDGAGPNTMVKEVPLEQVRDLRHDGEPTVVELDEAIDLLPAGNAYANMYVGFSIFMPEKGSFTPCQMIASGTTIGQPNANIYDFKSAESNCGPLAMQLLISNPKVPEVAATPHVGEGIRVLKSQTQPIGFAVTNGGTGGMHSIGYTYAIDGTPTGEGSITLNPGTDELDASPTLPIDIALPDRPGWHDLTLNIASVDGQTNLSATPSATGRILVLDQFGTKRTVMEEFTGTWCPNCPRGTVGMEMLKELFGERFIPIAVHNDDVMTIADYDGSKFRRSVTSAMGGFPSATVDRTFKCDPYMGYTLDWTFKTDKIVEEALQELAIADLSVEAEQDESDPTKVTLRARTLYYYNSDETDHALMLVLTADGLTGEGRPWQQCNEFVGRTDLPADMDEYVNGERWMTLSYDHVAVAVLGVENGIAHSIATPIVCQQEQTYTRQLTVPAGLIQEGSQLNAVAMLIDTTTGHVLNANTAPVTQAKTGIKAVEAQQSAPTDGTTAIYDLQGRRVGNSNTSLPKGIYLRQGRKVIVR